MKLKRFSDVDLTKKRVKPTSRVEMRIGVNMEVVASNTVDTILKHEVFTECLLLHCRVIDSYMVDVTKRLLDYISEHG